MRKLIVLFLSCGLLMAPAYGAISIVGPQIPPLPIPITVNSTPFPISLPTSFQTSFPTPIPFSATSAPCATPQGTGICTVSTSPPFVPANPLPVSLPTSYQTAFPTPIPFPTLGVTVQNTPGVNIQNTPTVNAGTGFPTPNAIQPVTLPTSFQTSFPTPNAVQPVSGTITVNTPAPFSGAVTQGTSPWVVNTPPPFSGVVTQGTSPWIVNTPPPTTTVSATQGTSPWVVTTPIPCATSATASGVCKVSIDDAPTTGTVTTVAVTNVSSAFLAANSARKAYIVCNTGNQELYISTGATASLTTLYASIPKIAGSTVSCFKDTIPGYTGAITGVWAATGTGNAVITSLQ